MLYNFKKVNISSLLIEPEFDYQSREKKVKLSEEGTNFSVRELNELRELSEVDHIKNLFEVNAKICNGLNLNFSDQVRWDYLIGKENCKSYTDELLREINFTRQFITTYHTEVLPQRKAIYLNLSKILDSEDNELEIPVYDHSGVSGRTSITSGFNFLTSSKDFRKSCKSSHKENKLISIDFKACEPNLYLRAIGKNIKNPDVYDYLMTELNIKVESRESLKRGILAVLYGASDDTTGRILGGDRKILDKIKSFFEIEEKTAQLQKEFDEQKFIFNMYGRPIFSDKSILNKWIQSSAVDFCSLAFKDFVESKRLKVAYLVHDDMVLDCTPSEYEEVKEYKMLEDSWTKISLPIVITNLSQ